MPLLTKVAKGVAYGDVSNQAVRNILTEISKSLYGRFTEQEMYDTMEYFGWRCPYTGKDLSYLKEERHAGDATDHIYPQNKVWCGLNVKGNLVIVDKSANARKGSRSVEDFLLKDTNVLKDTDELGRTRQERLDNIRKFQEKYGYNPKEICKIVQPLLDKRYKKVRTEQEKCINEAVSALKSAKIVANASEDSPRAGDKPCAQGRTPELIFCPSDEQQFKSELLNRKKAHFVLTYESGPKKESLWKCETFDETSNLRANIQSRPFWRRKKQEGLIRVEVFIGWE